MRLIVPAGGVPYRVTAVLTHLPDYRRGGPVLLLDGDMPADPDDALALGFSIVEATDEERAALAAAGFHLPEPPAGREV